MTSQPRRTTPSLNPLPPSRVYVGAFIFIVLLLTCIRFSFLRTIPAYFSHDELHYVTEAQSVRLSLTDLTGTWRPWHFRPTNELYAELPSTFFALGSLLPANPFLQARAVSILMGIGIAFLLGGIGWSFTKERSVFFLTTLIGLCNPWFFQFSRMSFDVLPSVFFYVLGTFLLLQLPSRWRLIGIFAFAMGFFQYQGLKVIFLPILLSVICVVLFREWQSGTTARKIVSPKTFLIAQCDLFAIAFMGMALFVWYIFALRSQVAGGRVNDILFFDQDFLAARVNEYRTASLSSIFQVIFSNKLTVMIQEFLVRYLHGLAPSQLFAQGELMRNPFAAWSRGMFHVADLMLVLLGSVAVISVKRLRWVGVFLLSWVLIAPIPIALNTVDVWLMFRGSWIIPTVVLLSGIGAWFALRTLPKVAVALLCIVYIYGVVSFGFEYFVRYPVYSTRGAQFAERVVANYIHRLPQDTEVIVLADESQFLFHSYLAYNSLVTTENLPALRQAFQTKQFRLGNVEYSTNCFDPTRATGNTVVITSGVNVRCDLKNERPLIPYVKVPSPIDNGGLFIAYNDKLCQEYRLTQFIHLTSLKQLDVERLSTEEFCTQVLSKPTE